MPIVTVKTDVLFLYVYHYSNQERIKGGGPPGPGSPIFTCKTFSEPYICPFANICLKISSYIDLKYV